VVSIEKIILISGFCFGVKMLFSSGFLLHSLGEKIVGLTKSKYVENAVVGCITCYASFWGTIGYLILSYNSLSFSVVSVLDWLVSITTVAGLNTFVGVLYEVTTLFKDKLFKEKLWIP